MRLSKHFSLYEFAHSSIATRYNIDNTPPKEFIKNGKALCTNILEPTRTHFSNNRITITSGFRCLALNRLLKSKDTSQHTKLEAADFVIKNYSVYEVAKWIAESDLPFDQVIYEFNNWIHVSYTKDRKPRRQALTIYHKDGKVITSFGIIPEEEQ